MNVAFIHAGFSNSGGIERVVSIMMNALSKDAAYNLFSIEYVKSDEQCVSVDDKVRRFYLYETGMSMTKAIIQGGLIAKVRKILKDNRIDIVIACGVLYFPAAVIAGKQAGAKSVCWDHIGPKICSEYKFQKQIRHFGLKHSDANVLITDRARKYYDSVKVKKNVLIYNPVDDRLFETSCAYDADSKKIISVGRLCYAKNYDILIEIADKVLSKHTDWSWDIYGGGEEYDRLQKLILNTSVADRLTLKGNVLNIYELYPEYSFLVLTSRYEGFPMVLLEAAANSLPLVSFDVETGPNEIIANGENGFLVDAGDADTMAQRIDELISDPEQRKKMSDNVHNTAQRFSVERISEQWKALIKDLQTE